MALEDSALGRLVGALVSPVKTFESIARRPTWIAPLLLLMAVGTASGVLANKRIDPTEMRANVERQMEKRLGEKPSDAQVDQAFEMGQKFGSIAVWFAPVFSVVINLLLALIFWLAFRFIAGSDFSFRQSFATLLHAFMPLFVYGLLSIPVILGRAHVTVREAQQGILASNLAAFAPENMSGALRSLLASVDFFSLWTVVLLIVGYRIVARASATAATATVVGLWLVWVLIRVGLGAMAG